MIGGGGFSHSTDYLLNAGPTASTFGPIHAVGTFKRPLAGVYVYKKFVQVFPGFIGMLIEDILKT